MQIPLRLPHRFHACAVRTACALLLIAYACASGSGTTGAFATVPRHDAGTSTGYGWPLPPPPEVTRGYDPPAFQYGRGHRGIDLAGTPGQAVLAAGPGTTVFAGPVAGRGVVSIDHPGGLRTTYEPVAPTVSAGDRVTTGTVIGRLTSGHPGCPVLACLHWGLRAGPGHYRDPRSLLGRIVVRLVPV